MPVVFVHGIGVRDVELPGPLTHEWEAIKASLRTHIAPVISADDPDDVPISRIFWGDLGSNGLNAHSLERLPLDGTVALADAAIETLGEAVQATLFRRLPRVNWPEAARITWEVVRDPATRAALVDQPVDKQDDILLDLLQQRLVKSIPGLVGNPWQTLPAEFLRWRTESSQRALTQMRRSIEPILVTYVGDILRYVAGRGRPNEPGPILHRVVDGLNQAYAVARERSEPLVVFSHSLGAQVTYDALTSMGRLLNPDLRVDFWAVGGGQLGLFQDLGISLDRAGGDPVDSRVNYLWNAWSSTDVLSFGAEGYLPGAHDTDFGYSGTMFSNHISYVRDPVFFDTFAAILQAHLRRD